MSRPTFAVMVLLMLVASTFAEQKVFRLGLVGEGSTMVGDEGKVGQVLIFDCEVTRDKKKHERYGVCTLVSTSGQEGVSWLCSMETYFPEGTILQQGTLYLKNGAFSGTTALVGGTGRYIGAVGQETLYQSMKTTPPSGNATMTIKF